MPNLPDYPDYDELQPSEEEVRMYRSFNRLKKKYSSKALLELAGLLIEEVRHNTPRPVVRPSRGVLNLPDF